MSKQSWQALAKTSEVGDTTPVARELPSGEAVLLYRIDGVLHAYGDSCPHYGCPLSAGFTNHGIVTCPCHNARFDLSTGSLLSPPALDDLSTYEVKEEGGDIFVGTRHDPEIPMPAGDDGRVFALVGGGAASAAAAERLRREGFPGAVVMITPEDRLPYDRTMLSKAFVADDEISETALELRSQAFYDRLGIEIRHGRRVSSIDAETKTLHFDDGSQMSADAILLATGGRPRRPPIAGSDKEGVTYLRRPEDAAAIRTAAGRGARVAIVGAGFIGTELAASLRGRGASVTVVALEREPFAPLFGERVGARFHRLHEAEGVEFRLGVGVDRVTGGTAADGLALSDGSQIAADLVVLAVGIDPVCDYLQEGPLLKNGSVPVDTTLATAVPGIWAAGDIASMSVGDRSLRVEHWVAAERQGAHAAAGMLGRKEEFPFVPFFWTRQYGMSFVVVGDPGGYEDIRYSGNVESGDFLASYFRAGRLIAMLSLGMSADAIRYGRRLELGENIGPDQLKPA